MTTIFELSSGEDDDRVSELFATREGAERHIVAETLAGRALAQPVEIAEVTVSGMRAAPAIPNDIAEAVHLARDVIDAWRQLPAPNANQMHAGAPTVVHALAALSKQVYQCGVPVVLKSERTAGGSQ